MREQQRTENRTLASRTAVFLAASFRTNLRFKVIALAIIFSCNTAASQQKLVDGFRMIDDLEGVSGSVLVFVVDFDDIHHFDNYFDEVTTGETEGTGAVDALDIVWLGESPRADRLPTYTLPQSAEPLRMRAWLNHTVVRESPTTKNADSPAGDLAPLPEVFSMDDAAITNRVGLSYGIGAIDFARNFKAIASSGFLGRSTWKTGVDNQILGPKAGIIWQQRRGAFSIDVQGFAMLGVNSVQVAQSLTLGPTLIPGALNRPLFARPVHTSGDDWRTQIAPAAEFRAQLSTSLSERLSLNCRWSSLAIQDFADPDPYSVGPELNDYVDVSNDALVLHQFYCGIEYAR